MIVLVLSLAGAILQLYQIVFRVLRRFSAQFNSNPDLVKGVPSYSVHNVRPTQRCPKCQCEMVYGPDVDHTSTTDLDLDAKQSMICPMCSTL